LNYTRSRARILVTPREPCLATRSVCGAPPSRRAVAHR